MYLCVCTLSWRTQITVEGIYYLIVNTLYDLPGYQITSLEFYWTQLTKVNVDALKS